MMCSHDQPVRRRRRGFTLIETAAAVIILATAVPPMLWAIQESHATRANPVLFSTARFLAIEKMEDIIADRHSRAASRGYTYLVVGNYAAENPVTDFPQFGRTVSFTDHGPWDNTGPSWSVGTGYRETTVTLTWENTSGKTQTLAISTIITDYDG